MILKIDDNLKLSYLKKAYNAVLTKNVDIVVFKTFPTKVSHGTFAISEKDTATRTNSEEFFKLNIKQKKFNLSFNLIHFRNEQFAPNFF